MTRQRSGWLAAALGLFIVGAVLLLIQLTWNAYKEAIRSTQTRTGDYASILNAHLDSTLRRVDANLQKYAKTTPLAALDGRVRSRYAGQLDAQLDLDVSKFPEITALRLADASGKILYSSGGTDAIGMNVADREYFRKVRDDSNFDLVYSDVFVSDFDKRKRMTVVRALRDPMRNLRGIVIGVIELEYLESLFKELDVGAGGNIALYRSDTFSLVARHPGIDGRLNVPLPRDSATRLALPPGVKAATIELVSAADARARIYSYRVMESYPFFVSVGMAKDEALASWRSRSAETVITGLLLLTLLSGSLIMLWRADTGRRQAEYELR